MSTIRGADRCQHIVCTPQPHGLRFTPNFAAKPTDPSVAATIASANASIAAAGASEQYDLQSELQRELQRLESQLLQKQRRECELRIRCAVALPKPQLFPRAAKELCDAYRAAVTASPAASVSASASAIS